MTIAVEISLVNGMSRKEATENAHQTTSVEIIGDSSAVDHFTSDVFEHIERYEFFSIQRENALQLKNRNLKRKFLTCWLCININIYLCISTSRSELLNSYGRFHPSGPNFLRSCMRACMKPRLNKRRLQCGPLNHQNAF